MYKLILIMIIIAGPAHWIFAQESYSEQCKDAYNRFDYDELDSLLQAGQYNYTDFSNEDKISFHYYSAVRAYETSRQDEIKRHFEEIMKIDPNFEPDPVTTSPKVQLLFDNTKIDFMEQQQLLLKELKATANKGQGDLPWRSLVFPGWEQWHRDYKTKAFIWGTLGIVTLGGTIQAILQTREKRNQYLSAIEPSDVHEKYKQYNRFYKSQYYWGYAVAAVWIGSHIDAVFFSPQKNYFITVKSVDKSLCLSINVSL